MLKPVLRGCRVRTAGRCALLLLTLVALAGSMVVGAEASVGLGDPCNESRRADLALTQMASTNAEGNTEFLLTVTNHGPACARGVQVRAELSGPLLSFTPVHPHSWTCAESDPGVATCSLTATIGVGHGGNKATVIVESSPLSSSHAIVGGAVSDPDCAPIVFCPGAGSNNESWGTFGNMLTLGGSLDGLLPGKGGPDGGSVPTVTITRPSAENISGAMVAPGTPSGVPPEFPPPCDPDCLSDRQVVVTTPPTGPGRDELMSMVIRVEAPAKPTPVVYRFNDDTLTWDTFGRCRGLQEVPCVCRVTFDPETGIAEIMVMTPFFSHWTK